MERRNFLRLLGVGTAAIVVSPSILAGSKIVHPEKTIDKAFNWNLNQIHLRIINSNPEPVDIVLFGIHEPFMNNSLPSGVKILVTGSTYENLLNSLKTRCFHVHGLTLKAKNNLQFINPMNIWRVFSNGKMEHMLFHPLNYRSALQKDPFFITVPSFEFLITPDLYLVQKINGNEEVDMQFNLSLYNTDLQAPKKSDLKDFGNFIINNSVL